MKVKIYHHEAKLQKMPGYIGRAIKAKNRLSAISSAARNGGGAIYEVEAKCEEIFAAHRRKAASIIFRNAGLHCAIGDGAFRIYCTAIIKYVPRQCREARLRDAAEHR